MFDAKSLLDQFLGAQGQRQTDPRQTDPQQSDWRNAGPAGSGFDMSRLGQMAQGSFGGIAGGAIAGSLASVLLGSKQARKIAGSALAYGGMAVVGALAYRAYRDWQAGRSPATTGSGTPPLLPPPTDTPFNPSGEADQQALGLSVLRAMIAAAKADGHVDAAEQAKIFAEMDKLALDAEAKAFVIDEIRAPLDIDGVARAARSPEQAAEIYAASLMVIDLDHEAERAYLAMLAARLNLERGLVEHLHASVAAATAPNPSPAHPVPAS